MIIGIIAEYNPFHMGHLYQINFIKNKYPDSLVIVAMAGSFVQRAEPAIFDKWTRTRASLLSGADLVLEIPSIFSTQNAEIFSKYGVKILGNFIDMLVFGAEDDIKKLELINKKVDENLDLTILKNYLRKGNSYIKSREKAMSFLTDEEKEILRRPNNILAMSYMKAKKDLNFDFSFEAIRRHMVGHKEDFNDSFASASYIRSLIKSSDTYESFVPKACFDLYKHKNINTLENYFDIFKFILLKNFDKLQNLIDYEIGIENLFLKNIEAATFDEFIKRCSSKRYSKTRIRRLCLGLLLGLYKNLVFDSLDYKKPYLRLLGARKSAFDFIKSVKKNFILIEKFSKIQSLNDPIIKNIALKEAHMTDLYNLFTTKKLGEDFTTSPLIISN
ncbi:hypothetical protein HMPREF3189_00027 [Clostridiales bacterium KA00134]|nr:hypothetical protein HMPREF3189_00027 [Clostridiales bacterium KA00134]